MKNVSVYSIWDLVNACKTKLHNQTVTLPHSGATATVKFEYRLSSDNPINRGYWFSIQTQHHEKIEICVKYCQRKSKKAEAEAIEYLKNLLNTNLYYILIAGIIADLARIEGEAYAKAQSIENKVKEAVLDAIDDITTIDAEIEQSDIDELAEAIDLMYETPYVWRKDAELALNAFGWGSAIKALYNRGLQDCFESDNETEIANFVHRDLFGYTIYEILHNDDFSEKIAEFLQKYHGKTWTDAKIRYVQFLKESIDFDTIFQDYYDNAEI